VREHTHHLAVERCTEDRHIAIHTPSAMLRSSNAQVYGRGSYAEAAALLGALKEGRLGMGMFEKYLLRRALGLAQWRMGREAGAFQRSMGTKGEEKREEQLYLKAEAAWGRASSALNGMSGPAPGGDR